MKCTCLWDGSLYHFFSVSERLSFPREFDLSSGNAESARDSSPTAPTCLSVIFFSVATPKRVEQIQPIFEKKIVYWDRKSRPKKDE